MSDLFGNHIVGFPTRQLNYVTCCVILHQSGQQKFGCTDVLFLKSPESLLELVYIKTCFAILYTFLCKYKPVLNKSPILHHGYIGFLFV